MISAQHTESQEFSDEEAKLLQEPEQDSPQRQKRWPLKAIIVSMAICAVVAAVLVLSQGTSQKNDSVDTEALQTMFSADKASGKEVSNKDYLELLDKVDVNGGGTLLSKVTDVTWPPAYTLLSGEFKNNALYAWGDENADNLYVWSVGTHALCQQYAETLAAVAEGGWYVLCPEISHAFTVIEWVEKSVCAIRWALAKKKYTTIATGGHSGGGPVSLASGYIMKKDYDVEVAGYALQHPGAVAFLNVPGCATDSGNEKKKEGDNYVYCTKYFPSPDEFWSVVKGKVLVACGNFCKWRSAGPRDSNWFGAFSCSKKKIGTPDCQKSYTPKKYGAPISCKTGKCPNKGWLDDPSDCMISTACPSVMDKFIKPSSGGVLFSHCGEHEFSVVGHQGLQEEGSPAVIPWMKYLSTGENVHFDAITKLNRTTSTCKIKRCGGDGCLDLVREDSAVLFDDRFPKKMDNVAEIESSGPITVTSHKLP